MAENIEDPNDIIYIYEMVDKVPLSRPKKNIARDFSDGVLLAEIIKHYCPHLVELHNYPAAHSTTQKLYNWKTLNVLKKIQISLSKNEIDNVIACQQGAIENILKKVFDKVAKSSPKKIQNESKDSDQNVNVEKANIKPVVSFPENDYKEVIIQKDNIIADLKSTIEILDLKLTNTYDENRKLSEKIEYLKEMLRKSGKL